MLNPQSKRQSKALGYLRHKVHFSDLHFPLTAIQQTFFTKGTSPSRRNKRGAKKKLQFCYYNINAAASIFSPHLPPGFSFGKNMDLIVFGKIAKKSHSRFNIASEASYVYILSGQKFIINAKKS